MFIFITNQDFKKAEVAYNTTTSGTTVYMKIELNKDGKRPSLLKRVGVT